MNRVRLELNELSIQRPKKMWNVYFVVATDHPEDESKVAVSVLPSALIRLRRPADNQIDFVPDGDDAGLDGLELLERNMPTDRSIETHLWVMHSRRAARTTGQVMKELTSELGGGATKVLDVLGTTNVWMAVARAAVGGLGAVGQALSKVRDRNMGFVSLGESFGPEFERETELDRANDLSTGFGRVVWTWAVVE